jgi:hypothetical protein
MKISFFNKKTKNLVVDLFDVGYTPNFQTSRGQNTIDPNGDSFPYEKLTPEESYIAHFNDNYDETYHIKVISSNENQIVIEGEK